MTFKLVKANTVAGRDVTGGFDFVVVSGRTDQDGWKDMKQTTWEAYDDKETAMHQAQRHVETGRWADVFRKVAISINNEAYEEE